MNRKRKLYHPPNEHIRIRTPRRSMETVMNKVTNYHIERERKREENVETPRWPGDQLGNNLFCCSRNQRSTPAARSYLPAGLGEVLLQLLRHGGMDIAISLSTSYPGKVARERESRLVLNKEKDEIGKTGGDAKFAELRAHHACLSASSQLSLFSTSTHISCRMNSLASSLMSSQ